MITTGYGSVHVLLEIRAAVRLKSPRRLLSDACVFVRQTFDLGEHGIAGLVRVVPMAFPVGRMPVLVAVVPCQFPLDNVRQFPPLFHAVDFSPAKVTDATMQGEQPGALFPGN